MSPRMLSFVTRREKADRYFSNTLSLILPILPLMPKELFANTPPLELAFSLADGPRSVVHSSFRDRSESLGRAGKTWPKAQLYKAEQAMRWTHGW